MPFTGGEKEFKHMLNFELFLHILLKFEIILMKIVQVIRLQNDIKVFEIQGSLNKFPDFFRRGTFIDSTHMKI